MPGRNGDGSAQRAPLSVRVIDGACVVFAVWTLCCHAVVAAGGSLRALVVVFALAGLVLVAVRRRWRAGVGAGPPGRRPPDARAGTLAPRRAEGGRFDTPLRIGGLALGVGGGLALGGQPVAFWWLGLVLLAGAFACFVVVRPPEDEPPLVDRAAEGALWGLAGFCALAALVAHRVDVDDVFYVNLAAAAAAKPTAPLLAADTLHGVPGLPIQLPVYRLHSYELWNGALAWLTGMPAVASFHLVSASVVALLVPLASARLARWLTPRDWPWTVAALVFLLVAVGEVHRWHGNFGLVRIWQGKGIFLFVFLPLVVAYAIELALRPRAGAWLRLAAAQVAALGATSTALWAGPFAALAAGACVLRPARGDLRRALLLGLASSYVIGAGVLMKGAMVDDPSLAFATRVSPETERRVAVRVERDGVGRHDPGVQLEVALDLVAGTGRLRVAFLIALVAAWACCPAGLGRRFAIALPLAVWLLLLDPYTTRFVSHNVVGAAYWRSLWPLPVLMLGALVLTAPLRLGLRPAWLGPVATVVAWGLFAATLPRYAAFDTRNGVELGWPRLKVPSESYAFAEKLARRAGPDAVVVAPWVVGMWLPMQGASAHPLVVRPHYLERYRQQLGGDDVDRRLAMTRFVEGASRDPRAPAIFAEGLARYGVRAVCLRDSGDAPHARAILRRAGFEPDLEGPPCDLWLRR
jgi:hypothetical protein